MPRIGLVYDLLSDYPWKAGDPPDADAEFEPEETVEVIEEALATLGLETHRVGSAHALLNQIDRLRIDAAVNIAEATGSRNREAYAPVLLEMAGIPYLGSDALTLSLSLDKAWTKDLIQAAGVDTPPYRVYASAEDVDQRDLQGGFPLFVKPRYEGTAKGILPVSKVHIRAELRERVRVLIETYRQDAIVERFVEGSEFTVAVIGNDPPEALPVLQRATEVTTGIGLHALERKGVPPREWGYELTGGLDRALEEKLQRLAIRCYEKLECKDFARVDFRVDRTGRLWFLEINPLPTFAPDGTFAIIAELTGQPYGSFLASVLARGFRRIGLMK